MLRRGRVAGAADPKTTTRQELANLMVGRDVELIVPKGPANPGKVVLSLQGVQVRDDRLDMAVDGVDLEVRAGEIVAIAGVQGNGQTELVEAIVGLRSIDAGQIDDRRSARRDVIATPGLGPRCRPHPGGPRPRRPHRAMSVAENYILDTYHREPYSKRGIFDRKAVRDGAAQGVKDFDIRTPSVDTSASLAVGRQPAEGRRRARVLCAGPARGRRPADAWP